MGHVLVEQLRCNSDGALATGPDLQAQGNPEVIHLAVKPAIRTMPEKSGFRALSEDGVWVRAKDYFRFADNPGVTSLCRGCPRTLLNTS
jgi:hypothetical protein